MIQKPKRILLVEDDPTVRDSLKQAITLENYHVISAENTHDALSRFKESPTDIALLDINLGVEDGWEIFKRLIRLQPLLPIIVMSAQADRLAHPDSARALACLPKPLDLTLLFRTLREHCPTQNE